MKVLQCLDLKFEWTGRPVGGAAYDAQRHPLPEATLKLAKGRRRGAVRRGGRLEIRQARARAAPEQAILGLRKNLGLFANFRPAICYEQLTDASSLKPELVAGLDIPIIRRLTGDIYFGQPRGRRQSPDGGAFPA